MNTSTQKIVDEGIIRYSEDMIYPGQNTGIDELPSECEAHHFQVKGYAIRLINFCMTSEDVIGFLPAGTILSF